MNYLTFCHKWRDKDTTLAFYFPENVSCLCSHPPIWLAVSASTLLVWNLPRPKDRSLVCTRAESPVGMGKEKLWDSLQQDIFLTRDLTAIKLEPKRNAVLPRLGSDSYEAGQNRLGDPIENHLCGISIGMENLETHEQMWFTIWMGVRFFCFSLVAFYSNGSQSKHSKIPNKYTVPSTGVVHDAFFEKHLPTSTPTWDSPLSRKDQESSNVRPRCRRIWGSSSGSFKITQQHSNESGLLGQQRLKYNIIELYIFTAKVPFDTHCTRL